MKMKTVNEPYVGAGPRACPDTQSDVGAPHAAPVPLLSVHTFRAKRAPNKVAGHIFLLP